MARRWLEFRTEHSGDRDARKELEFDVDAKTRPSPGKVTRTMRLASNRPGGARCGGAGKPVWREQNRWNTPTPDATRLLDDAQRRAGSPLPDRLRTQFESLLGVELAHVRVHQDARAAAAADAIHANAFTLGHDVYFAAGRYQPQSPEGRRLLAHEVAHTVQEADAPPDGYVVSTPAGWPRA